MSISHIIRSGLAAAQGSGSKEVELHHLPEGGADELAEETLAFLRGRPGRPSSVSGWTAVSPSKAGVVRWWADEAGMTTEAQRRTLRTLRRQTYDLLDERGLIVKPARPSAVVDVSPASPPEAADEKAPEAEPTPAAVPKAKAAKANPAEPATPAKPAKAAKPPKPAKPVKAAKPAEAAPADVAPTEAMPAEAESASSVPPPTVDDEGAWILRLDPRVWDLARFIAEGNREVSTWAVEDNERSAAMSHGQRVFLWAGGDDTLVMAGLWGVGWVVGPCQSTSVADGYWLDPAGNTRRGLFADVSIQLLAHPVPRQQVLYDPLLAAIEVLQDPHGSNPSRLTPGEGAALLALVGFDPALPDR